MKHALRDWYRDLWLLVISITLLFTAKAVVQESKATHRNIVEIQQGRRATASITCAVSAAVVKAGRLTIITSAQTPLPPKLEVFLQQHGYPPKPQREAGARRTAAAYTKAINEEVLRAAGVQAFRVLEPPMLHGKPNPRTGTLNCTRLRTLANIR